MPHAVPHGEDGADLAVPPPDVGELLGVDVDEEADEGDGEALAGVVAGDDLLEHLAVCGDVKRLGLVHAAGVHLAAVPEEVVDCLHDCPGAHVAGDAGLVGELQVVEAEGGAEEDDNYPIDELQDQTADGDAAVVLACTNAAQLVFDNWH